MARVVRYHDDFRSDVSELANWFEKKLPGLGDEFAVAIENGINDLRDRPFSFRVIWKQYRRVLIRRFRVIIPFEVTDENVFVLGVVHGTRHVPRWMKQREES